jgi:hypothetical protein
MGDPYKGRLAGHSLFGEGGPDTLEGEPLLLKYYSGRGKCSCGAVSEILPSTTQRRAWHRQHKADVISKGGSDAE